MFTAWFIQYTHGPLGGDYGEFYVIARSYFEMKELVEQEIKSQGLWHRVGWRNIEHSDYVKEIPAGKEVIWYEQEKATN